MLGGLGGVTKVLLSGIYNNEFNFFLDVTLLKRVLISSYLH